MNLEQVQRWLAAEQSKLDASGIRDFELKLTAIDVYASGFDPVGGHFVCGIGMTIDEAMRKLRARIPQGPEAATKLRDKAKDLLRQAKDLEGGAS